MWDPMNAQEQLCRTLREKTQALARRGVLIGTSSWKYPGWIGQIYCEDRYLWRGKFSETRFKRACLEEYAEIFPTVCVDAGYYQFPTPKYIQGLTARVPRGFRFSFKVTDEITIKHFPKLPRFGKRAGQDNPNFLNAELFKAQFLGSLQGYEENIGLLIFEFSQFYPRDFQRGRDFVEALETFLQQLPRGWQYGVEIRNKGFLKPGYFEMLTRQIVAHVYNNWSRMPPVAEQLAMPDSLTAPFTGARFLLTPGRGYQEAVDKFSPYQETLEIDEQARQAGRDLIRKAAENAGSTGSNPSPQPSYVYVNNRLEGNAINTIMAMVEE
jgi:uncharacterized protein YecE (DUF72 family)